MPTTWNALTLVQEFSRRQSLPVPAGLVAATDDLTLQLWGVLNETLELIANHTEWQALHRTATFKHAGSASNYLALDMDTPVCTPVVPYSFKSLEERTLWNATNRLPVLGPVSNEQWQAVIQMTAQPAQYIYRMYEQGIWIYPYLSTPTFSGDFVINESATDAAGAVFKQLITADTDKFLLPPRLIMAGLKWRWRDAKGLNAESAFAEYQEMLMDYEGSQGQSPEVNLASGSDPQTAIPGLMIPAGNWNL